MDEHGVPVKVWAPIAYQESTFNPDASNTVPPDDSWGLFAENRRGGQGAGHPGSWLQDPVNNAMLAAPWFQHAMSVCGPDDIVCIALHSGHPSQTGSAPGSALPGRILGSYNAIKTETDDASIYTSLMAGHTSGGGSSSGGSSTGLGSFFDGLAQGLFPGLFGPSSGAVTGGNPVTPPTYSGSAFAEQSAPLIFGILGLGSLIWGIMAAAITSPPGQAAVAAGKASGNAQLQVAAAGAQAVGGAPAAAGRTVGGVVRAGRSQGTSRPATPTPGGSPQAVPIQTRKASLARKAMSSNRVARRLGRTP